MVGASFRIEGFVSFHPSGEKRCPNLPMPPGDGNSDCGDRTSQYHRRSVLRPGGRRLSAFLLPLAAKAARSRRARQTKGRPRHREVHSRCLEQECPNRHSQTRTFSATHSRLHHHRTARRRSHHRPGARHGTISKRRSEHSIDGEKLVIGLPDNVPIYLCTQTVDFRKGFAGLTGVVTTTLGQRVADGALFLFVNRKRDRVKTLRPQKRTPRRLRRPVLT